MIQFDVDGIPRPQGSKTAFVRGGRAVIVEGGPSKDGRARFKAWRKAVSDMADCNAPEVPLDCPLRVQIEFRVPRPISTSKNALWAPKRPDLDKYIRAIGDSLTGRIYTDDSRIVELRATKKYSDRPGCTITVTEL